MWLETNVRNFDNESFRLSKHFFSVDYRKVQLLAQQK